MFNKPFGTSLTINAMQTGTFITGVVLVLGSLFFKSLPVTLGVLAGGLLACINFVVLQKVVVKITAETTQQQGHPRGSRFAEIHSSGDRHLCWPFHQSILIPSALWWGFLQW